MSCSRQFTAKVGSPKWARSWMTDLVGYSVKLPSPGFGLCRFGRLLHLSGTFAFRSHGSSPSGFSGWKTRPSGQSDLFDSPFTHVQYLSHCSGSLKMYGSEVSLVKAGHLGNTIVSVGDICMRRVGEWPTNTC